MLEKYLQMFAKLRTDKGRDQYPQITYHRAPHEPFCCCNKRGGFEMVLLRSKSEDRSWIFIAELANSLGALASKFM
jgi:hypothetical protein